jgi:hypothetical protein
MREYLIGNKFNFKHGCSNIPEYWAWTRMISRCYDKNNKSYNRYGGRGIIVCDLWRKSFAEFLKHIGRKPNPEYSLDRINNDGNYEPNNVRWTTWKIQRRNTDNLLNLTFKGKTQCLSAWAEEIGIDPETLRRRIKKYKWNVKKALTTPVRFMKPFKRKEV